MNRLTKRGSDGIFLNKYNLSVCSGEDFYNLQSILDRLATYEDTGLEPEEIEDLKDCIEGEEGTQGTVKDLLELVQYRKLEEQGLLIKLPCKVGDTVYYVNLSNKVINYMVSGFKVDCFGNLQINVARHLESGYFLDMQLGKTVFLTREEAEKALNKEGNY
jgi:hypothetical protein